MGIFKKMADSAKKTQEKFDAGLADAIMEEQLDPKGREHKGQPPGAPKKS